MSTANADLQTGLDHQRAGRWDEARLCYTRILKTEPSHQEALELAGSACLALGRIPEAITNLQRATQPNSDSAEAFFSLGSAYLAANWFNDAASALKRALQLRPSYLQAWCTLAGVYERSEKLEDAAQAYRQAVAIKPDFAEVHCNLGGILLAQKRYAEAVQSFDRAMALKPSFPEVLNGLGVAYKGLGSFEQSIACLKKAVALRPSYSDALYNLGNALQAVEAWTDAIAAYRQALTRTPQSIDILHNLACALYGGGHYDSAIACHRRVLALQPDHAGAWNHLGNALLATQQRDEAMAAFQKALQLKPDFLDAYCNLGNVHLVQNDVASALEQYRRASSIAPDFAPAEYNQAIALLLLGKYQEGFLKYERRWETEQRAHRRTFPQPLWTGEADLQGKTLLLHCEQGMGDTLQFVRYAPLLAERGARVILEVQPALRPLLEKMPGIAAVYNKHEAPPTFDYHCPLLSLPRAFGTTLETIPAHVPYLNDSSGGSRPIIKRLKEKPGLHVGLVCSGNPKHKNDQNRSISLVQFKPCIELVDTSFYLLQKDVKPLDLVTLLQMRHVTPCGDDLKDFCDTAAMIEKLDLVISVDTSVAHLAGAMGKPVWLLLPFAPDWRWMLARSDSPWYPTMRLFRQSHPNDWNSVIATVTAELKKLARR